MVAVEPAARRAPFGSRVNMQFVHFSGKTSDAKMFKVELSPPL